MVWDDWDRYTKGNSEQDGTKDHDCENFQLLTIFKMQKARRTGAVSPTHGTSVSDCQTRVRNISFRDNENSLFFLIDTQLKFSPWTLNQGLHSRFRRTKKLDTGLALGQPISRVEALAGARDLSSSAVNLYAHTSVKPNTSIGSPTPRRGKLPHTCRR